MMRITPRRRTTLQCSQIGFTLARTFIVASLSLWKTEARKLNGIYTSWQPRGRLRRENAEERRDAEFFSPFLCVSA